MTTDLHLKNLLSPARSGTFFAPFRSRSANPDGFDSKMKLWMNAIDEWAVINKRITLSVEDVHLRFLSNGGIRPDKECVRLVFSEMKRKNRIIPLSMLRKSKLWSSSSSRNRPLVDSYIDPKGWIGWGVKNFVYNPASWALSALSSYDEQCYSDLTDMSILDDTKFVCQKSLHELSQKLLIELIRISKAEKQACFEWQHLFELISPILNTIIDATDGKELLEMLDLLVEYLAINKNVSIQVDNDTKLVKVTNTDDQTNSEEVTVTKKDVAMARLMRAKELLTVDADKYHDQAHRTKQDALGCYAKKEIAKAKSLLRSHKRLVACAEQKEAQLTNVEIMLDQLESTNSNMIILKAYKDGADALKAANTQLDNNTSILDDMFDATAEARHLNEEMNHMLNEISRCSRIHDISNAELEAELEEYMAADHDVSTLDNCFATTNVRESEHNALSNSEANQDSLDNLEARLNRLIVFQDLIDESKSPDRETEHCDASPQSTKSKKGMALEDLVGAT